MTKLLVYQGEFYFQDSNYPNINGVVEWLKRNSANYGFFVGVLVVFGGTYTVIGFNNGAYRSYIAFTYWSSEPIYKINCENGNWSFQS